MLTITIDYFDEKKGIWHIKAKSERNKFEETICPSYLFEIAMDGYQAMLDNLSVISEKTKEARDALRKRDIKKIDNIATAYLESFRGRPIVKNRQAIGHDRRAMVEYLDKVATTTKSNINPESLLQKIAVALTLAGVTFIEITDELKVQQKFERHIPINEFSALTAAKDNQTNNWLSVMDSALSIGKTLTGV